MLSSMGCSRRQLCLRPSARSTRHLRQQCLLLLYIVSSGLHLCRGEQVRELCVVRREGLQAWWGLAQQGRVLFFLKPKVHKVQRQQQQASWLPLRTCMVLQDRVLSQCKMPMVKGPMTKKHFLVVKGHPLMAKRHPLMVKRHLLVVKGHPLTVQRRLLMVKKHLLVVEGHLLMTKRHLTIIEGQQMPLQKGHLEQQVSFNIVQEEGPSLVRRVLLQEGHPEQQM